jgi:integrase/recombinase XerD
MWVGGSLEGKPVRKSLKTQSWERAKVKADEMERTGKLDVKTKDDVPTLSQAVEFYLNECQESAFSTTTVYHHRKTLERFNAWCTSVSIETLNEIDTDALRKYFAEHPEWEPGTRVSYRMQLATFFAWCMRRTWINANPIKELPKIKVRPEPTLPFSDAEFDSLMAGIDDPHMRALLLLLRWSGLRIGDAVSLERIRIDKDGVLMLTTQKTSATVRMPLPDAVLSALDALPATGPRYFMQPGQDQFKAVQHYRRMLLRAAKRLKMTGSVHFHRFRDTFAVGLLLAGTGIDTVSRLLGHSNVATTMRFYNPWVASRQAQSDAAVRSAWQ